MKIALLVLGLVVLFFHQKAGFSILILTFVLELVFTYARKTKKAS